MASVFLVVPAALLIAVAIAANVLSQLIVLSGSDNRWFGARGLDTTWETANDPNDAPDPPFSLETSYTINFSV